MNQLQPHVHMEETNIMLSDMVKDTLYDYILAQFTKKAKLIYGLICPDTGYPWGGSDWEGPWGLLGAGYILFHDLVASFMGMKIL